MYIRWCFKAQIRWSMMISFLGVVNFLSLWDYFRKWYQGKNLILLAVSMRVVPGFITVCWAGLFLERTWPVFAQSEPCTEFLSLNHQFSVSHSSSSHMLYVQSTFTVRTLQENLHSICGWESKPRASVHGPILYSQPIRENIAYSTMAASWNTFMEVVPSWISLLVEGGGLLDISWCLVISRKGWLSRQASLSTGLNRGAKGILHSYIRFF